MDGVLIKKTSRLNCAKNREGRDFKTNIYKNGGKHCMGGIFNTNLLKFFIL